MSSDHTGTVTVYKGAGPITETTSTSAKDLAAFAKKTAFAKTLCGGVIMEVTNPEQARIAEVAGACAVMATEHLPSDIRSQRRGGGGGGVFRMCDPQLVQQIRAAVRIPVFAKARIGHFVEAQILESIGVNFVDECEVLTVADQDHHINKHNFRVPFICSCRSLGEALRRIAEGAAMIRTSGEAGTGNVVDTVRHLRAVMGEIRVLSNMDEDEVFEFAKKISAPYELVWKTKEIGRLPVLNFAGGGISTPADVALMMQLGCDGVFIGSGVFKSGDPVRHARAMVRAATRYTDPGGLADLSYGLGEAMPGLNQ
ncbi:hypothetical protein Scep_005649 [Stephania cephalantha]|uniref:pyridoxal 5'-phosphate synthase (glutamine hydrolyzing) n=1 Tax=Stephania cephalantha TaxID=152367 RepID=A0AAP0KXB9_9MAGN